MYYNNKPKFVLDSLLITDKEHIKPNGQKYKDDKFKYQCTTYKSNDAFENDLYAIKEESHVTPTNPLLEYRIEFISNPHIQQQLYEEEKQQIKHYGDIDFYEWLSKQDDPKLAIFAELVNAPRLHINIENMRDKLQSVNTMSIQEYKKIKKLGSRSVKSIKELKTKYGNAILQYLYLSAHS